MTVSYSKSGRGVAELLFVFVGVSAAFWLNNVQQHQQEAKRRDQILASLERTLREGIESGRINGAKEERQAAEFQHALDAGEMPRCIRSFLRPITVRAILPRCFNPAVLSCSMWRRSPRCAMTNRLSGG